MISATRADLGRLEAENRALRIDLRNKAAKIGELSAELAEARQAARHYRSAYQRVVGQAPSPPSNSGLSEFVEKTVDAACPILLGFAIGLLLAVLTFPEWGQHLIVR